MPRGCSQGLSHDRVEPLLAILDEMVAKGLVTMEKVRIVKYSPGSRALDAARA
jgi:hypothetical protein